MFNSTSNVHLHASSLLCLVDFRKIWFAFTEMFEFLEEEAPGIP